MWRQYSSETVTGAESNIHYHEENQEVYMVFYRTTTTVADCLCGLVIGVPGYRSTGSGSIPGATRFSEKYWVWNGVHSAS
jgi:hypothetical protein